MIKLPVDITLINCDDSLGASLGELFTDREQDLASLQDLHWKLAIDEVHSSQLPVVALHKLYLSKVSKFGHQLGSTSMSSFASQIMCTMFLIASSRSFFSWMKCLTIVSRYFSAFFKDAGQHQVVGGA